MKKSLIHIKLDHDEIINSRKKILGSEVQVINIMRSIEEYKELRMTELRLKTKLKTEVSIIKKDIAFIINKMPQLDETPQEIEVKDIMPLKRGRKKKNDHIETQLKEIQKKLSKLK